MSTRSGPRVRVATLVVAAVSVLALAGAPGAAGAHGRSHGRRVHHHHVSAAQRRCLVEAGATLPSHGYRPGTWDRLGPELRQRVREALRECGLMPPAPTTTTTTTEPPTTTTEPPTTTTTTVIIIT